MNTTIINTKGVEATTLDETLKAADLDWQPMVAPVYGHPDFNAASSNRIAIPNFKMLYRSDNHAPLGITGTDYTPSDPVEFVRTQFELAQSFGGKVVRVGFLEERARAFAFVRVSEISIPKGSRKVGDPLQAYIYTTDGWDGGTPRQSRLYIERLRCLNGMTSKELAASLWVSHTSRMVQRYQLQWGKFQVALNTSIEQIKQQFTRLAETRMSKGQCEDFLIKLLPGDSTRVTNRRNEIINLFGSRGAGNEGVTRWDAYNAVTEYVTHHRGYRETENTSIETNRFLGVLETDKLAKQALELLLARN